jgi:glycosyltransferase involved in cell wall biosynthesis
MRNKVLVLGPGRKTRGGISTVIKEYEKTDTWKQFDCKWIGTYVDKNNLHKIGYFLKGFFIFLGSILFHKIVHIHISWSTTSVRKIPFFLMARLLRRKIVLHLHSAAEPVINAKTQFAYKYMFRYADVTICLADRIRNELQKHYQFRKTLVIYNPCVSIFNQQKSTDNIVKKNYIVFAGTVTEKKGYIDLLEAFGLIASKHLEWKLIFAGNGELENARRIAKVLDIEKQVVFKGWIDRDSLQNLLQESSIFCLPSYTEGFPMAVLDAWAQGLPVVTTPVGGLADILVDRTNALVFEPGNIEKLASNLNELITNEILRNAISKESIKLSTDTFHINTIAKQLNELYVTL